MTSDARKVRTVIGQTPFVIAIVLVLSLLGCSALKGSDAVTLRRSGIEVNEDKIYRNGQIFAELRYLFPDSSGNAYRGIAIYYYPSMQEVWIYPEGGWQIRGGLKRHYTIKEIEEARANGKPILREGEPLGKEAAIAGWCFDIKISEDGRSVFYMTHSSLKMFLGESLSKRSGQYLIDYTVRK